MAESYELQYDDQGRPYYQFPGQKVKNYVSPAAFGEQVPEDTGGIFQTRPEWNQYDGEFQTGVDWGNILSMVTGAGLGAGALGAAGVFGAGGGTAAGGGGAVAGGGGAAAGGGAGAGAALASAAGASSPWWETALKLGIPVAATAMATRGNNDALEVDPAIRAQQEQLLAYGNRRLERIEPVHEAAMALAKRIGAPPSAATQQRMGGAIQDAQAPRPQQQMSPEVLEAVKRLMGGR